MAKVDTDAVVYETNIRGLTLAGRGKVRDIYDLGDSLLIIATDRLSAFDVVFPTPIPQKGRVLTQMTLFWLDKVRDIIPNHLIAADTGRMVEAAVRAGAENSPELRWVLDGRSMLVVKAQPFPIECVVRGYISGSMWKDYKTKGEQTTLYGHNIPSGLKESEKLPQSIFTPATKATSGHDENISTRRAAEIVGQEPFAKLQSTSIAIYERGLGIAAQNGIIIADTKFEFGVYNGDIILIDEILTPDSSRFWDAASYTPGNAQDSFDKQYVRDWLETRRWDKKPPAPDLPSDIVEGTKERYIEAYRRVTGQEL